jgi:hypothetical protein
MLTATTSCPIQKIIIIIQKIILFKILKIISKMEIFPPQQMILKNLMQHNFKLIRQI